LVNKLARRGFRVDHKCIERMVRDYGLYADYARRKEMRTTIPDFWAPPLPDLVQRDFRVGEPGLRTCGNITYIRTDEGWHYFASVLDLGSRRLVGYAMDAYMRTEFLYRVLTMAIDSRGHVEGMIFHHDCGSQYMSNDFRALCDVDGILQSAGRTGSCHDNVIAESLWATMKSEFVHRYRVARRRSTSDHRLHQSLQ
jgi:transposase InsO family protein